MQEHFIQEIENLKSNLIQMASLVDEQTDKAISALESGDVSLCKGVKSKDIEVDIFDNKIQAQCENILALFQPVTIDLRFVIAVMMINTQLERCGDIAVNISQRVKKTSDARELIKESEIIDMAKSAKEMLKLAIDCLIHKSIDTANLILKKDEEVDKYNKKIFKFLVEKMKNDSSTVDAASHLIVLARHIERLADHATNIAENIIFYLEANIVAHKKKFQKRNIDEDF